MFQIALNYTCGREWLDEGQWRRRLGEFTLCDAKKLIENFSKYATS